MAVVSIENKADSFASSAGLVIVSVAGLTF
jgi:hypothetical protein